MGYRVVGMKPPIFVRTLSNEERKRLEAGLRSKDAFTLRRSQMLLASSRGDEVPQIAENLGCGQQTGCATPSTTTSTSVVACCRLSLLALRVPKEPAPPPPPPPPSSMGTAPSGCESCSPPPPEGVRQGHSSLWTLEMAAQVAFEEGLTQRRRVSGETISGLLCGTPPRSALAKSQALDHFPRSPVRKKKRRRDRLLMRVAEANSSEWAVGFEDECCGGAAGWLCPP